MINNLPTLGRRPIPAVHGRGVQEVGTVQGGVQRGPALVTQGGVHRGRVGAVQEEVLGGRIGAALEGAVKGPVN